HLEAQVDRPALRAVGGKRANENLDRKHDRPEDAYEDHCSEPDRIHQSNFASGRNRSDDRLMPWDITWSKKRGRIPVASNFPITCPSALMPVCRKRKISCIVTTSPSMPVSSDKLTSLRRPSDRRATWTTTFSAE